MQNITDDKDGIKSYDMTSTELNSQLLISSEFEWHF